MGRFQSPVPVRTGRLLAVVLGLAVGLAVTFGLSTFAPGNGAVSSPSPTPEFALLISPAIGEISPSPSALAKGIDWRVTSYGADAIPIEVSVSAVWITATPQSFTLAPGASQRVHIAFVGPVSQPAAIDALESGPVARNHSCHRFFGPRNFRLEAT
jgi:hypothetical protein